MPKPATFTPAEIPALADRLREGWRPGSQITPWLRDNAERLTKLNREERFSWAAVASALNEVGITYRTGNPWTATNRAKAVSEARTGGRRNPVEVPTGFTLLEVLVALVILGLALGMLSASISESLDRSERIETEDRAATLADGILARLGEDIPLRAGVADGQDQNLSWRLDVSPEPGSASALPLDKVDLTIWNASHHIIGRWRSLRVAPP